MSDTKSSTLERPTGEMRIAVSTVIFALRDGTLQIPLVRRIREPFEGRWALPGGWVAVDESLSGAASRTLAETTGLRPAYLEQLYTFGLPERSPRERVISVVYFALLRSEEAASVVCGENVRWCAVDHLPRMAFDHNRIIDYALWRLRNKVEYAHVAFHFLGETFTLAQLRAVYEAILGRALDPANFRRHVEAQEAIDPTDDRVTGGRHRPPRLYRCRVTTDALARGPVA